MFSRYVFIVIIDSPMPLPNRNKFSMMAHSGRSSVIVDMMSSAEEMKMVPTITIGRALIRSNSRPPIDMNSMDPSACETRMSPDSNGEYPLTC